jgi:hypothetical protein
VEVVVLVGNVSARGGRPMPTADPDFVWQEAVAAFGIISVAAFLVTWVFTDLLKIPRTPYIPILVLVALGLLAGYLAWSGTSGSELFSSNVAWGLAAGLIAAAVAVPLVHVSRPIRMRPGAG